MDKSYQGGGNLVTRLLGRLEIQHGLGTVEFRLRSETEIDKRGIKVVLRIVNLPEIPRIEHGTGIQIDMKDGSFTFDRETRSNRADV